jgi:methylglutaconyl-CoA hydratase
LNWMQSMVKATKKANAEDADKLFELFYQAATCPTPIVGRLHGNVMGGGLGLASICDIVVAETDTKFCFSEVRLGIAPAVISSFVLKKMQPSVAREYMITGEIFDSTVALRSGLVHYVARELEMKEYIDKIISSFKKNGPEAVRATKTLVDNVLVSEPGAVRDMCVEAIAELRTSKEGQEGIKAFLEKRKASWIITDGD